MNKHGLIINFFLCKNTLKNKKQIFLKFTELMIIQKVAQKIISFIKWKAVKILKKMIAFDKYNI